MDSNDNCSGNKSMTIKQNKSVTTINRSVRDGGRPQHQQQHQGMATPSSHIANDDSAYNGNQNTKTTNLQQ